MEQLFNKRKELISKYHELKQQETNLESQVINGMRNNDLFFEIEKEQNIHAINRVLSELVETELPVMKSIVQMYNKILEKTQEEKKNKPYNEELINKVEETRIRYEEFCRVYETLQDIVKINDNELYELDLAMRDINNVLNTGSEDVIREALTNYRIMRGLYKVCCIEVENDTFNMMYNTFVNLSNQISDVKEDEPI